MRKIIRRPERRRRFRGIAVAAVAGLTIAAAPAGAAEGSVRARSEPPIIPVLFNQTTGTDEGNIASTDFSTAAKDPLDAQGADDFVVPPGGPWRIASVGARSDIVSIHDGPDTFSVSIYEDDLGEPGQQVFSQSGIPVQVLGSVDLWLTGAPLLYPGTYWLSVQAAGPSQWSWQSLGTQQGLPARWRNPPDGSGKGCTIFKTLADCGFGTESLDFAFFLQGEYVSNEFTLGPLHRGYGGNWYILGNFPGMGKVVLRDRRVAGGGVRRIKSSTATLVSLGYQGLRVTPTAATRKRLKAGKTVNVAVEVTYTPTGYPPKTITTSIKLKGNLGGG